MHERLDYVQGATEEGRLLDPETLIEDLILSEASDCHQRQVLLGQVALAVDQAAEQWISDVSGFCFRSGFGWCSEGWIQRHVGVIPRWARTHSGRPPCQQAGSDGVRGDASNEDASTSRTSEEAWTVVRSPKRARRLSPIKWEEVKVVYDPGCFKCGEPGHYKRECRGEWLCHRCKRHGHKAVDCPGPQPGPKSAAASTSRSGPSKVPQVSAGTREKVSAPRPAAASTSRSGAPEVLASKRSGAKKRDAEGKPKPVEEPKGKCPKFKTCPVPWCKLNFFHKKGHVFKCHYPTALAMDEEVGSTSTDTRFRLRVSALQYLARTLVGLDADIGDLVDFINRSGCLDGRESCQVDQWTRRVANETAEELGLPVPEEYTCNPINSPGVIFQYRVMLAVVGLLGETAHDNFLQTFSADLWPEPVPVVVRVDEEGNREICIREEVVDAGSTSVRNQPEVEVEVEDGVSSISVDSHSLAIPSLSESEEMSSPRRSWLPEHSPEPDLSDMVVVDEVVEAEEEEPERDHKKRPSEASFPFQCVDSHFHLDRLCKRIGVHPFNYQDAVGRVRPLSGEEVEIDGAVAVWCDPKSYPTKRQVAKLRKERVVSVLGIHPGKVQEGDTMRLARMLDTFEVAGLGEVGLDGTKEDPELQRKILDETLALLKSRPHLVLVLHCRPREGESVTGAYFELFYRCKGLLRPDQRIHLHCFNGTMEDVSLWLGYFPNTYFGYSLMVTRSNFRADSKQALGRIDASRILLETDAPYFPAAREEISSPSYIGVTAREVARVRGCDWKELLRQTAENAQQFYWG